MTKPLNLPAKRPVRGLPAHSAAIHLQPFVDIKQPLFSAKPVPLRDETEHDHPHRHQMNSKREAEAVQAL